MMLTLIKAGWYWNQLALIKYSLSVELVSSVLEVDESVQAFCHVLTMSQMLQINCD